MTRRVVLVALVVASIVGAVTLFAFDREPRSHLSIAATTGQRQAGQGKTPQPPTLYCDFYNFMRNATVVSFYFSVEGIDPANVKVSELFVIEPDGTKTEFANDGGPRPEWAYRVDDGNPTVTSPDGKTDIVLYGFKPQATGTFWTEAGLRSNDYRNLEGKCRQTNFGNVSKRDGPTP